MATSTSTTGFPDATNSGLPAGVTLTPSGSLVVTQAGAVISGLDITGTVQIEAPNVTLIDCKITSPSFAVVNIATGVTGTVVQNCEINGTGSNNDGDIGIFGSGTFIGNNIYNVENGIAVTQGSTSTVIQNNYIHDLLASGSPHYDGIQMDGDISNVTISHNTIINTHNQTSAIMVDNGFGAISNISVDSNLLVGGGYTVYDDATQGTASISGVSFTNNHIGAGGFGTTDFHNSSPTYTGNVDDGAALLATLNTAANTGTTTTTPPVATPPVATPPVATPPAATPPATTTSDTTAPAAPVLTGDSVVNTNHFLVTGTAEANSTITVYDGSTQIGSGTTNSSGHWSVTTSALSVGAHDLTASATDAAGNVSDLSQTLDPVIGSTTSTGTGTGTTTPPTTTPVVSSDPVSPTSTHHSVTFTGLSENASHVASIQGTADVNSLIKVYNGTAAVGTTTSDSSGHWTFNTGALPDKVQTFSAQEVDSSGNILAHSHGYAVVGSTGSNVLTSVGGNDVFVANGHPDTFVFNANFGQDVINNFVGSGTTHDTIQFSSSEFSSFASVLSHASQVGQDVVIASGTDSLTLKNTALTSLHSHDFHFA